MILNNDLISVFCSCESPKKCMSPDICGYAGYESFDEYFDKNTKHEVELIFEHSDGSQKILVLDVKNVHWK